MVDWSDSLHGTASSRVAQMAWVWFGLCKVEPVAFFFFFLTAECRGGFYYNPAVTYTDTHRHTCDGLMLHYEDQSGIQFGILLSVQWTHATLCCLTFARCSKNKKKICQDFNCRHKRTSQHTLSRLHTNILSGIHETAITAIAAFTDMLIPLTVWQYYNNKKVGKLGSWF